MHSSGIWHAVCEQFALLHRCVCKMQRKAHTRRMQPSAVAQNAAAEQLPRQSKLQESQCTHTNSTQAALRTEATPAPAQDSCSCGVCCSKSTHTGMSSIQQWRSSLTHPGHCRNKKADKPILAPTTASSAFLHIEEHRYIGAARLGAPHPAATAPAYSLCTRVVAVPRCAFAAGQGMYRAALQGMLHLDCSLNLRSHHHLSCRAICCCAVLL